MTKASKKIDSWFIAPPCGMKLDKLSQQIWDKAIEEGVYAGNDIKEIVEEFDDSEGLGELPIYKITVELIGKVSKVGVEFKPI